MVYPGVKGLRSDSSREYLARLILPALSLCFSPCPSANSPSPVKGSGKLKCRVRSETLDKYRLGLGFYVYNAL